MTAPAMTARSALRVRLATLDDLDAVAAFLARSLGGEGGPPRYRRLFEYTWLADKPNIGALVESDGRIGGFLGALYSRRVIGGRPREICNLTSWAVDEPYRRASLAMLKCLLDQRGHTFTTFSASPPVAEILGVLKFETVRSHKLLFTAAAAARRPRGEPIQVLDGAERVAPHLGPDHRQILDDHRPYRCGHVLVERGNRRCYAVTIRRGRGARMFADVLYASDPQLFVDAIGAVQRALFRVHRTVLTGIDLRWVDHPPALAVCYTGLRPVMFRGESPAGQSGPGTLPSLHARDICALHSELVPMYG
jgi:hypothetical protein